MFVPARRSDPEILDRPDNHPAALEAALADIREVNRRLGGSRALLEALDPFLDWTPEGEEFSVLDVGSGGGDLLVDVAAHVTARGRRARVVGVDRDSAIVAIARRWTAGRPEIEIVAGDAMRLAFPEGSFDVVTASMFLHHFEYQEVVLLLRRFRKFARKAVVVNDLRRHLVPWAFVAVWSLATRKSPMFRHDAPLSVLRGFTDEELAAALEDAGGHGAVVMRRWPFRLIGSMPAAGRAGTGPTGAS